MIDNTHVVVLRGTGCDPGSRWAFAERGFRFAAHERGDANRSARVERNFDFIEINFFAAVRLPAGTISMPRRAWCDRVNSTYKKFIRAVPRSCLPPSGCV
jgi:hypothetical protein